MNNIPVLVVFIWLSKHNSKPTLHTHHVLITLSSISNRYYRFFSFLQLCIKCSKILISYKFYNAICLLRKNYKTKLQPKAWCCMLWIFTKLCFMYLFYFQQRCLLILNILCCIIELVFIVDSMLIDTLFVYPLSFVTK